MTEYLVNIGLCRRQFGNQHPCRYKNVTCVKLVGVQPLDILIAEYVRLNHPSWTVTGYYVLKEIDRA